MLLDYLPIGLMLLIGVAAGFVFTHINRWIGPTRPSEEKLSTYESGMEPVRTARGKLLPLHIPHRSANT